MSGSMPFLIKVDIHTAKLVDDDASVFEILTPMHGFNYLFGSVTILS